MLHLPLFPLNSVLFPGMPLYLHIFEPRYRLMIHTCLEQKIPFGVVLIRQGMEALGPVALPYQTGCIAQISQVERLEDGCMNLTVVGEERFQILELDTSQAYLAGMVETRPLENPRPLDVLRGLRGLKRQVREYLERLARIASDELDLSLIEMPDDTFGMLYMAASLLQVPTVEKQPLLEAEHAGHLFHQLYRIYRREIAMMSPVALLGEEQARRSSWLN